MHKKSRDSLAYARALCAVPLAALLLAAGYREAHASTADRAATPAAVAAKANGYLKPEERPDSAALLPPPPAPGSKEAAADAARYRELQALEGTARWTLARADSNLKLPEAVNTYACALGIQVDPATTPRLYALMQRTIIDAGQSTNAAKSKYDRDRPFEDTGARTCVPEDEPGLRSNGSYPSGHASLGYVWGEVLAEVVPQHAAALRDRAYQFGQSRVVCRVHYQSDVDAGRAVGAAVMPRLRSNAEYRADLAAAKVEARQALERAQATGRNCAAEAGALRATAPRPEMTR